MGAAERRKGATFEREARDVLRRIFGSHVQRRLGQARDGGEDFTGTTGHCVEAKRRKSFKTLYDWMAQCVRASGSRIPVLVIRADNEEMLFVVRAKDCASGSFGIDTTPSRKGE